MRFYSSKLHTATSLILLGSLFVAMLQFVVQVETADAAPNLQINYQGKLTDASDIAVPDGSYNMRFWLLTSPSIATTSAVWTESLTGANKVTVSNGLFSVMLGSTSVLSSVDFNQTLYLGVEIGGSTTPAWDGEMSPRKILGTVPSAFEADRLDGLTSNQFVRTDAASTIATSTASTLLTVTQNGAGDILNLFDGTAEVFSVLDGGFVGVGTSSPIARFSVAGNAFIGGNFTATGTANFVGLFASASSTLGYASSSALTVSGNTFLSALTVSGNTSLQAATSTNLYATTFGVGSDYITDLTGSGLSVVNGVLTASGGSSNWLTLNGALTPTSSIGISIHASSTIGGGTGATGLTISGGATTTGSQYIGGSMSIGTTSQQGLITMDRSGLTGAVIGGVKQYLQFSNSTQNAVYYGNHTLIANAPSATSTLVGNMIRLEDNSQLGNVVRGLEVQAHRGTNTKGENTAINAFGRTFGVKGTTEGDAGDTARPAGVYAETRGTTQGNALRAYSGSLTTESLVSLYQDASTFVGTALALDMGNGGGSFSSATSKFLNLAKAGVSQFAVLHDGSTSIGTGTPYAKLSVQGIAGGNARLFDIASTTNAAYATTSLFTVLANGNVGVGTSTPQGTLSIVSGTYGASLLKVNAASGGATGIDIGATGLFGDIYKGINIAASSLGITSLVSSPTGISITGTAAGSGAIGIQGNTTSGGTGLYGLSDGAGGFAIRANGTTGADPFVAQSSGVTNFIIKNSGNVAVGTTSPWARLSIQDTPGSQQPLFAIASTTNAAYATSSLFTVVASGTVGIGTSNPGGLFNIDVAGQDLLTLSNTDSGQMRLDATDSHDQHIIFTPRSSVTGNSTIRGGSTDLYLGVDSNTAVIVGMNGTLTVGGAGVSSVAGSLGIGSTTPSRRLTVSGDILGVNLTATGTLTVSGNTSLTAATATNMYATTLGVGTDYLTDLTGTGLSIVGGALTATGGSSNWLTLNGALTPTSTTIGISVHGSSTIGGGTGATGLTISGNSTTTGNSIVSQALILPFTSDTNPSATGVSALGMFNGNGQIIFADSNSRFVAIGSYGGGNGMAIANGNTLGFSSNTALSGGNFTSDVGLVRQSAGVLSVNSGFSAGGANSTLGTLLTGTMSVGTSTPYAKLSVQNTYGSTTRLFDIASTTNAAYATTSLFTVLANGNVGVGTSTPETLVTIANNVYGTSALRLTTTNGGGTGLTVRASAGGVFTTGIEVAAGGTAVSASADTDGTAIYGNSYGPSSIGVRGYVGGGGIGVLASSDSVGGYAIKADGASGADPFLAQSEGIGKFIIKNSGSVGVGTTSPWATLSIQDAPGSQKPLFSIASTTNAAYATTSLFTVLANGNVGVGTSTPSRNLQIVNGINTATFRVGISDTSGSYFDVAAIPTTNANGVQATLSRTGNDWNTAAVLNLNTNGTTAYSLGLLSSSDFGGNFSIGTSINDASPAFSITTSKNVGIGSTTPSRKLTVSGDILGVNLTATGTLTVSGNTSLQAATATNMYATTLGVGSDYITDITGTGLSVVNGVLTATGGSGSSNWLTLNGALTPSSSIGISIHASSTIGGGTGATGLTIDGNATTTGVMIVQGAATSSFASNLLVGGDLSLGSNKRIVIGGSLFGTINSGTGNVELGNTTNATYVYGNSAQVQGTNGVTLNNLSNNGILFQIASTTRATLSQAGNFGIGSTTPSRLLTVAGEIYGANLTATGTVQGAGLTITSSSTLGYASSTALTVSGNTVLANATSTSLSTGSFTATGNTTLTSATSTTLRTTTLGIGSDYITDITGAGLTHTNGSLGVATSTFFTNSSQFGSWLSDETGTGNVVFSATPNFTGTMQGVGLTLSGSSTLGYASSTALTVSGNTVLNGLTLSCASCITDANVSDTLTASAVAVGGITGLGTGVGTWLATPTTANFAAAITGETGTGNVVFSATPLFTGTIQGAGLALTGSTSLQAATATNMYATTLGVGTDYITDITGTGIVNTAGVLTASLGTDIAAAEMANSDHGFFSYTTNVASLDANGLTSANILSALTDETGTGNVVFSATPNFTGTMQGVGLTLSGSSTLGYASSTGLTVSGNAIFGGGTGIWNSSGNVGIGTTTPARKLTLAVSGSGNVEAVFQNSTTGGSASDGFYIGIDANEVASFWNYENTGMEFGNNGTSMMLLSAAGNLGIGSSTPSRKLTVSGDIIGANINGANLTATGTLTVSGNTSLAAATSTNFNATAFGIGSDYITDLTGSGLSIVSGALTATGGSSNWLTLNGALTPTSSIGISIHASSTIGGGTGATGLTISGGATTTGNAYFGGIVGIGTANPVTTLDVNGTFAARSTSNAIFGNGATGGLQIGDGTLTKTSGDYFVWNTGTRMTNGGLIFGSSATPANSTIKTDTYLDFYTNVSTFGMRLDTTGNLGIGTTTPNATLTVSSTTSSGAILRVGTTTNSNLFTVLGNGNVGIGTANPTVPLDVTGNIRTTTGITVGDDSITAVIGGAGGLNFNTAANARMTINDAGQVIINDTFGSAPAFQVLTSSAYLAGSVGIGTTSPRAKLAVVGDTYALGTEAISNGTFTGNANGWELGACAVYGSNKVTVTNTACSSEYYASTTFSWTTNTPYVLTFTLSSVVGDTVYYYFENNSTLSSDDSFGEGTHTVTVYPAEGGSETLLFENSDGAGGSTWTIDDVSIRPLSITPTLELTNTAGASLLSMGVSTSTLENLLTIQSNTQVNGRMAIGNAASMENLLTFGSSASTTLNIADQYVGDLGEYDTYGLTIHKHLTHTSADTNPQVTGLDIDISTFASTVGEWGSVKGATINANSSTSTSEIYALDIRARNNSGNSGNVFGLYSLASNSDQATTSQVAALYVRATNNDGYVQKMYGLYVSDPSNSGVIQDNYGIRIASQTGITTRGHNLNFYSEGLTSRNAFAGSVSIGTTTPYAKLNIQSEPGAQGRLFDIASTTNSGYATTSLFTVLANGNVGIGSSTPQSLLTLSNTNINAGSGAVAGLKESFRFVNSTESALYYGDNAYIVNAPTATSTLIGKIIRIEDNSQLGNTVRGLEVQAHRGTTTKGENTGISGFGRTFGVRGTTEGDAGDTYIPAGVIAETRGTTQGNALRAYSGTITTSSLAHLFHDTSVFTGTGLLMNFGNTTGSFAPTSAAKFIDLQSAGTSKFTVTAAGTTTIGDGTTANMAGLQIGYGGLCVDNDGACTASTTGRITSVSSALGNSDLAEIYFSSDDLVAGDIVMADGGLSVARAEQDQKGLILGVVSTKPGLLLGHDDHSLTAGESGYPIALKGRVPIRLSTENGVIEKGDRIALSSIPGIGMKATQGDIVVGIALEDYDGTSAYTDGYFNQFGDDLVKAKMKPLNQNTDTRTQDGCSYGAGDEQGTAPCVKDSVTAIAPETISIDTKTQILAELRAEEAETMTTENGEEVTVGQALMFVHLDQYATESERNVLSELLATTTEQVDGQDETVWDRLKTLATNFVDGVLKVAGIRTEELCVGSVCVDEATFLRMVQSASVNGSQDNEPEETEEEPEVEELEGGEGEGEVIPEPEVGEDPPPPEVIEEEIVEETNGEEEVEEPAQEEVAEGEGTPGEGSEVASEPTV